MKIIGIVAESSYGAREAEYILEANGEELARIMGRMDSYVSVSDFKPKVGDRINVNKIFKIIDMVRQAPQRFKKVSAELKELSDLVRDYHVLYEKAFEIDKAEKEGE